jgi:hypothetical protein
VILWVVSITYIAVKYTMQKYLLKRGMLWDPRLRARDLRFAYDDEKVSFHALEQIHRPSYEFWRDNPFDYRINSWGHRGSEFTPGGLVFLGCSYTWGWGMREQWAWPWLVGSELGLAVNCMGYPGEGNDRASMLALGWIRELRPPRVYFLDLFTTRRTWLIQWEPGLTVSQNHDPHSDPQRSLLHKIACAEPQEWFDQQRNLALIQRECQAVGSELYHLDYEGYKQLVADQPRDRDSELKSRDRGNHPSRQEHELIARAMLSRPNLI